MIGQSSFRVLATCAVAVFTLHMTTTALAQSEDRLADLCEEMLVERLVSPSTYERIEADIEKKPLDRSSWLERVNATGDSDFLYRQAMRMRLSSQDPDLTVVLIEYDAGNAFGGLIRATAQCEYVWTPESALAIDAGDVWLVSGALGH